MVEENVSHNKYIVGPVARFDQKNEMFKRTRWDPTVQEMAKGFWSVSMPSDKGGFTRTDMAMLNAGYFIERAFAHGNFIHNTGLYSWQTEASARAHRIAEEAPPVDTEPREMSRRVKKVARFLGADLVNIGLLDRRWVYSHSFHFVTREHKELEIPEECRYAIVIAVEMDYTAMKVSPTCISRAAAGMGYSKMAFVSASLAQFVRDLGYTALPSGNDTALDIPIAVDAGMGEMGRNGLLITPEFGPRVRIAKVLTDLPLEPDPPLEFGAARFCEHCVKCAALCPSQALPHGDRSDKPVSISTSPGVLKWPVDAEKCLGFWARNGTSCGSCIRVCPFNKPAGWLHDGARWLVKNAPWADSLLVKGDDLLGYHKPMKPRDYWARP